MSSTGTEERERQTRRRRIDGRLEACGCSVVPADSARKLTQAVLAKAFRGELVPTEAELARREGRPYEPASALLERITAKREAKKSKPRSQRSRRTM